MRLVKHRRYWPTEVCTDLVATSQGFTFGVMVKFTESKALTFGAAASNAFNHPNYGSPSLNLASPSSFGAITSLQSQENGGPRSLQLTARLVF